MKIFKSKLKLLKGTRFVSFLFIGCSILVAAGILFAANIYYNIDTGEIVMEEIQRTTGLIRAVGGAVVGGTSTSTLPAGVMFQVASDDDVLLSGQGQVLRFSGGTGNYVGFMATSTLTETTVWTLPAVDGSTGQVLITDGDGILSWGSPEGMGTITAVGNVTSGAAFTGTDLGNTLYFRGPTAGAQTINLTAVDTAVGRTITLPDASGTVALGTATAGQVAYWSATNTLTGEAYLATGRGGTGIDSSALSGMVRVVAGGWGAVTGNANYAAYWSDANTVAAEQYLAVSRGGTGAGTFTQYGVIYGDGTNSLKVTAAGSQNQLLTGSATSPTWGSILNLLEQGTNITITATGTNQALIATVDDPYFATSVTSPLYTSLGTTTIASAAGQDIILDPSSGRILLTSGSWIETDSGFEIGKSGTENLREMIPIMGFDLPVQTASTSYVQISRVIERYPFLGAATGTDRVHKLAFRYAASTTAPIEFRVFTNTEYSTSTLPVPQTANVDQGEAHIVEIDIPTGTTAWRLEIRTPDVPSVVRVFQVFLAAYDVIQ